MIRVEEADATWALGMFPELVKSEVATASFGIWRVEVNGTVTMGFGAMRSGIGFTRVWMALTKDFERQRWTTLKAARPMIQEANRRFGPLFAQADNEKGARFIEWAGFRKLDEVDGWRRYVL